MGAGVMQESQKMPLAVTDLEIILVLIVAAFLVAPDVSEIELAGVGKLKSKVDAQDQRIRAVETAMVAVASSRSDFKSLGGSEPSRSGFTDP